MHVLSGESLLDAMEICGDISNMHVCILFENQWSFDEFVQTFRDELQYGKLKGWAMPDKGIYRTNITVRAPNGSSIYLVNSRTFIKAKFELMSGRFFKVLYENGVDKKLLEFAAQYELVSSPGEIFESTSELDDFLSSFKII